MLKKDGILVYSTCSIYKEENEYLLSKVLNKNKDIDVIPIEGFYYDRGKYMCMSL